MTEKEKAKELIKKFKSIEIGSEGFHSWGMEDWQAKECAIICCDEIIDVAKGSYDEDWLRYWKNVKKEINNL